MSAILMFAFRMLSSFCVGVNYLEIEKKGKRLTILTSKKDYLYDKTFFNLLSNTSLERSPL